MSHRDHKFCSCGGQKWIVDEMGRKSGQDNGILVGFSKTNLIAEINKKTTDLSGVVFRILCLAPHRNPI